MRKVAERALEHDEEEEEVRRLANQLLAELDRSAVTPSASLTSALHIGQSGASCRSDERCLSAGWFVRALRRGLVDAAGNGPEWAAVVGHVGHHGREGEGDRPVQVVDAPAVGA